VSWFLLQSAWFYEALSAPEKSCFESKAWRGFVSKFPKPKIPIFWCLFGEVVCLKLNLQIDWLKEGKKGFVSVVEIVKNFQDAKRCTPRRFRKVQHGCDDLDDCDGCDACDACDDFTVAAILATVMAVTTVTALTVVTTVTISTNVTAVMALEMFTAVTTVTAVTILRM
jgi:hypothetical protein